MRNLVHISALVALTIGLGACSGSKSYAKKGAKLDAAGLYAEAADMYLQSARRSNKNVDAKIGLKKTGQQVLNDELGKFFKLTAVGTNKEAAVTSFLNAEDYLNRVRTAGVVLELPDHYRADYEKVKAEYLTELYLEGQGLFSREEFGAAEKVFARIAKLEPNYKDASSLQDVAYLEPLYRQGSADLAAGKYRQAYGQLSKVVTKNRNYKDATTLRDQCVAKGQFVVAVLPFKETGTSGVAANVQAHAMTALTETNDPFLKVVDRENLERILEEQRLGLSGIVDENTAVRVGNLIGAQAVLLGEVIAYREVPGKTRQSTKEGYEAYKVATINKETGQKGFVTQYKPVNYTEYLQENKVVLSFSYRLVSLETGEILVSKVVDNEATDQVYYAAYQGDGNALYPKTASGATDLSMSGRDKLRALMGAPRTAKPLATLANEVVLKTTSNMAFTVQQDLSGKLP